MTTTAFNFDIGFSDAQIEVTPEHYAPAWPQMAALQPAFWRLVIDWQWAAVTLKPGPFQGVAKSPVTATITGSGFVGNAHTNGARPARASASGSGYVTGVAPSAQGRNWAHIDGVLNDMRLQTNGTMDIIMVIGQAAPNGWTNADYKAFCAECVVRYGPGGQGIRTDGIYAAVNAGWGVRSWEIWNEENNSGYWTQTVNAAQFTSFLQAGYQGIKSIAPTTPAPGVRPTGNQSVVIFGGMQHEPFSGVQFAYGFVGLDEVTFLQQCYAAAIKMGTTLGTMFDAMATHVYPYGDFAYSSGPGQQFPSNIISSMNFPAICTSANSRIVAGAFGSGAVNITPTQSGRLTAQAGATGNGTLNNYEPSGLPQNLPTMYMDNMRQVQGVYALMAANGDGAKKIKITECGYGVYEAGSSPDFQNRALQALFALFNTLPYIDCVLLYNAIDANNSKTADGYTGFGAMDYDRNPRPLYNWLLTLPSLRAGGSQTVTAAAAGTGSLGGAGAASAIATGHGDGVLTYSGGIIVASIHGTGVASLGSGGAPAAVAAGAGAGIVAVFGDSGGDTSVPGGLRITAGAIGLGRTGVQPHTNGDMLARAAAFGFGSVDTAADAVTAITAVTTGTGTVNANGAEIGVVGEVTGGVLGVTVTRAGAGASATAPTGGSQLAAASATGVGHTGTVGAGVSTVSATGTDSASSVVTAITGGTAPVSAAGSGTGFVDKATGGTLTVTAGGGDTGSVVYTDMGAKTATATATGAGTVGPVGSATPTLTATAVGAALVAAATTATLTASATATGTGGVFEASTGSLTATATIAGAGVVTVQRNLPKPKVVHVFSRHRLR